MKPLVCLPVYNEEKSIARIIEQIKVQQLDLIVVDGHSTDRSAEIARAMNAEVVQRDGKGKGRAVIKGLEIAEKRGYDFMLLVDCDASYPVNALSKFLAYDTGDLIIAVRNMQDIEVKRRAANIVMTGILNTLFGSQVKDMASGMRALRVVKFKGRLTASRFDIEPQICSIALANKFKIEEFAINYYAREGKSKVGLIDFFEAIWRMVIERLG